MNNAFSFVQRYVSGIKNKFINDSFNKLKKLNYYTALPENNFCVAVKENGLYIPSYLNNVLELDEEDIKHLADKYYGKLLDEMKNKVETITAEYTELINDFDSLENGK